MSRLRTRALITYGRRREYSGGLGSQRYHLATRSVHSQAKTASCGESGCENPGKQQEHSILGDNTVDDDLERIAKDFCDDVETHKAVVRKKYPEYPPFVRETVSKLREVLRKLGEPAAVKDLHAFLTKMPDDNPTRFKLYEAAIRMFLREGHPIAAVTCYTRMNAEGFLCPISLRAQMAVISLVNRSPEPEDFFALLEKWFSNSRFNERAFQDMLFLIDDVISEDPAFIDTVAKLYLQCKQENYAFTRETLSWIVYIHARAGSKKAAKDWLESDQPAAAHSPEPYVSLLRCAGDSSEDEELSRWVIQRMRDLDITPNLAFYTALLSTQCAQKRYDAAFKMYAALRESPEPALLPNKLVFAHLFRAHREMYQPRSLRTRTIERPHAAPSPRQLFRDMVLCHAARTEHGLEGTLTSSSLIPALRVFLWRRDYAAAYVVFKVMRLCKVPMDLEMYQRILAPILRRLKEELPLLDSEEGTRSWWTHRFLGLSSAPRKVRPVYGTPVLDMVLRIGMQSRLSLAYIAPKTYAAARPPPNGPHSAPGAHAGAPSMLEELKSSRLPGLSDDPDHDAEQDFREHEMPSTQEVAGVVKVNPFNVYSPHPLERILRRVILASRPPSSAAPMNDVNYEIGTANEQMGKNLKIKLR